MGDDVTIQGSNVVDANGNYRGKLPKAASINHAKAIADKSGTTVDEELVKRLATAGAAEMLDQ